MVHHLLYRRWRAAARANPVLLAAGLPLLGWLWLRWTVAALRAQPTEPVPRWVTPTALGVAVGWMVVRNVSPSVAGRCGWAPQEVL